MPYIEQDVPAAGDPLRQIDAQTWIDNISFLKSSLSTSIAPAGANGSFESFDPVTFYPHEWTYSSGTNGVGATISTDSAHGKYCFKFTRSAGVGNSGGTLESSDFFEVSALSTGAPVAQGRNLTVQWQMKSSAAGVRVKLELRFYTRAQVFISATSLYDSTANPTAWTGKTAFADPPATAYYAKLRITGGDTAPDIASDILFDDVAIYPTPERVPQKVVFNANSTWTCPAGILRARIRVVGGGGGGAYQGGGGGGGGYGEAVVAVTPGTVYTVTVGSAGVGGIFTVLATGGTSSSVNTASTVNGGGGGAGTSSADGGNGGLGTGTGGIGNAGEAGGYWQSTGINAGGDGGSSGSGAPGTRGARSGSNADNATNRGAGGGGGGSGGGGGGNGAAGRVIIEY